MNLAKDALPHQRSCNTIVLIGDGATDLRILEALAHRFDGRGTLCYPGILGHRGTGIESLAENLVYLLHQGARASIYLLVVDWEHGEPSHLAALKDSLLRRGVSCTEQDGWLECRLGPKRFKAYLAVNGAQECRSIEHNLAQLIHLQYGVPIECDKRTIRKWLRDRGLSDRSLVSQASSTNLREAFRSLTQALEHISHLL